MFSLFCIDSYDLQVYLLSSDLNVFAYVNMVTDEQSFKKCKC